MDATVSDRLAQIAVEAVQAVAEPLRTQWGRPASVSEKASPWDLVTQLDRDVEAQITEALFAGHPDSTVEGEESGRQGDGAVHWYVDPIDGTANFVHGVPFFCTSVAAVVDGHPVAAVVHDPVRRDLFVASAAGAYLNGTSLVAPSRADRAEQAVLLTAFPYEGHDASDDDLKAYRDLVRSFGAVRRLGSIALELAYVAAGRAQVAFELRSRPWDVAAGLYLVERAGGSYRTSGDGPPEEPHRHLSRSFLACQHGFRGRHPALERLL